MTKQKHTVRLICLAGVMAALYVGLDFFAVSISAPFGGNLKISLSGLPVLITAMVGGPLWGAATGFVGAFVGQMITYGMSATTLLWVLPAVVRGLSMGLLFRAFKKSLKPGILTLETCISSLLVRIPAAYIMGKVLGMGLSGVGYAAPAATTVGLLISIGYLMTGVWRRARIKGLQES